MFCLLLQYFEGAVDVEVECAAFGIPVPAYSWYKGNLTDGQRLTSANGRYTLSGK